MKNKPRVIGVHGFARSGKDTIADYIKDIDSNYITYSFAYPLKNAVASLFNIQREDLDGDNREVILPEWGKSIREILQLFGTESIRNVFGEDFWINKAQYALDDVIDTNSDIGLVISDVRFDNEADFCRNNGILIHVARPEANGKVGVANHASESGVNESIDDYYIVNDGSLDDLYKEIQTILDK